MTKSILRTLEKARERISSIDNWSENHGVSVKFSFQKGNSSTRMDKRFSYSLLGAIRTKDPVVYVETCTLLFSSMPLMGVDFEENKDFWVLGKDIFPLLHFDNYGLSRSSTGTEGADFSCMRNTLEYFNEGYFDDTGSLTLVDLHQAILNLLDLTIEIAKGAEV